MKSRKIATTLTPLVWRRSDENIDLDSFIKNDKIVEQNA